MRDVKKWIHDFDNLEPEQQFEIALAISNHIVNGNSRIDFREYDEDFYEFISGVLSVIIDLSKEKKTLKSGILEKYIELSQENKLKIADQLYGVINHFYQKEGQGKKEAICAIEGHKFGKWQHHICDGCIDTVIDHQPVKNFHYKCDEWRRTCLVCGVCECVRTEPEEARKERLEQERQEEVRRIRKRLRELEDK